MGKFGPIHSPFLFSSGRILSIHPHPIPYSPQSSLTCSLFFVCVFFFPHIQMYTWSSLYMKGRDHPEERFLYAESVLKTRLDWPIKAHSTRIGTSTSPIMRKMSKPIKPSKRNGQTNFCPWLFLCSFIFQIFDTVKLWPSQFNQTQVLHEPPHHPPVKKHFRSSLATKSLGFPLQVTPRIWKIHVWKLYILKDLGVWKSSFFRIFRSNHTP